MHHRIRVSIPGPPVNYTFTPAGKLQSVWRFLKNPGKPLHHGGTEPRRKAKINGFSSDRRNFDLCNKSFDISTRFPHRAGEDTESGHEVCRLLHRAWAFRALIFLLEKQL